MNPGPYKRTIGAINVEVTISGMSEFQAASQKIGPSRWFHLLALAMIAAGATCAYRTISTAIHSMQNGLTRAIFPGEVTVSFSAPGEYEIYYENISEFDGRVFDTGSRVPGLAFTVTDNETGETIAVQRPSMSEKYEINGRRGRAVLQFHVARPGSYKIAARYDDNEQHEEAVFAVGNPHIARLAVLIIGGIFCILAFGGGSVLVIVLIETWRYSSKRKLQAAATVPGSAAPPF